MNWTYSFTELSAADVEVAGGKGANLGELTRAGLPVPPGFVLLTDAYRAFVAANGLQAEIERLARTARPGDTAPLEAVSAAIRALFEQGEMPEETANAVKQAYHELGSPTVAVRSSATAEDLPGASFAGQQETYLNIHGDEAVLAAVRRCWSSLWTPRAIAYRANHSIDPGSVALAVVVQQLVTAEVAGILFTANPVNGRRDQMVIDGAWGLGEAVVSDQVTPDHWVADGASGSIITEQISRKEVMTVRTPDGTETRPVEPARQQQPVLDAAGVAALVDLGRMAAAHYGTPQDMEWAFAGGAFYLVQSRPIASLYPLPEPVPPAGDGLHVYLSINTIQGLVDPFTPSGISLFQVFSKGISRLAGYEIPESLVPRTLKVAGGRMYVDVTSALRHRRGRLFILNAPRIMDRPLGDIIDYLAQRESAALAIDPRAIFFRRFNIRLACRMITGVIRCLVAPARARERVLRRIGAAFAEIQASVHQLTTIDERVRFLSDGPISTFPDILPTLVPPVIAGMAMRIQAEEKLKAWTGDAAAFQSILRSLPHNPTTQMDLDLWRLSRRLKAEGAAPAASHPAVAEFLARYGHRAAREIDAGVPRWSEEPGHILNVLQTYLAQDKSADAVAKFEQGAAEAERTAAAIVQRVREARGSIRAALMKFALHRTRALLGMREVPKFHMVRIIALFRRVMREVGEELAQAGRLERAEDVYFLDIADLQQWRQLDLMAKAAANREAYERDLSRKPPRVMTSTGEAFYASPTVTVAEGSLVGTAASAGVHEGVVRLIFDPRNAELKQGEVLVAPGTDPAWTPLFLTAGALVMEIGGPMSHGSVVAREYGIPAVVGVAGATTRLKTGQRVRVDGGAGTVTPLDD